jgi:hypothetical protein
MEFVFIVMGIVVIVGFLAVLSDNGSNNDPWG